MGNLFTLCEGKRSNETSELEITQDQNNQKDSNKILKEFEQKPEVQTNNLVMNRIHPIQSTYESNSKIDIEIGKKFGF